MVANRNGESGSIPFRTGRFFNVGVKWYFITREAIDQGPYPSKNEATFALTQYIENCLKVERVWH